MSTSDDPREGSAAAGAPAASGPASAAPHPLDPLTAEEIRQVASVLRRDRAVGPRWRFASIELAEPAKDGSTDQGTERGSGARQQHPGQAPPNPGQAAPNPGQAAPNPDHRPQAQASRTQAQIAWPGMKTARPRTRLPARRWPSAGTATTGRPTGPRCR